MTEDKIERAKLLQQQIDSMQKELETVEVLLDLNDKNTMTDAEKAIAFDKIFDLALEQVKYTIAHGRSMKDSHYYLFEIALESTLGDIVFCVINEYVK
jgi:hypothetical protein